MGKRYKKVESSALSGFGREIGKNAGKALSNYIFGDNHATPIKVIRQQERQKLLKFKAQQDIEKLQGKKVLEELKHQHQLELVEKKEAIRQKKLEEQEELAQLEELRITENKNKVQEFEDYIKTLTTVHSVDFEVYKWKDILRGDFEACKFNTELSSNISNIFSELEINADSAVMLELDFLEIELELSGLKDLARDFDDKSKELIYSNNLVTFENYKNALLSEFPQSSEFIADFLPSDKVSRFSQNWRIPNEEVSVSYDSLKKYFSQYFEGIIGKSETIIELEGEDASAMFDRFADILINHELELFREKGRKFKEYCDGVNYHYDYGDLMGDLRELRRSAVSLNNYLITATKSKASSYIDSYLEYVEREREIRVYAIKALINKTEELSKGELIEAVIESEHNIIDFFSNVYELVPNIYFAYEDDDFSVKIVIENKEEVIPSQKPVLLRGKDIKEEGISEKDRNDWFQDYICGIILRVAGELFAFIDPLENIEFEIQDSQENNSTGNAELRPILRVDIEKSSFNSINLTKVDASNCLTNVFHANMNWNTRNGFGEITENKKPIIPTSDVVKEVEVVETTSSDDTNKDKEIELLKKQLEELQSEKIDSSDNIEDKNESVSPIIGKTYKTDGTKKRTIIFNNNGDKIEGVFALGKLEGVMKGNTLTGTFTDSEIAPNGGLFEFVFNDDYSVSKGVWKEGLENGELKGKWKSKRI
jgi:hypothetical protein